MRLAEAIADTRPAQQDERRNRVDELLESVHPDDLDEVVAMLMNPKNSHVDMADMLSKVAEEYVADTTVGEWRRRKGVRVHIGRRRR